MTVIRCHGRSFHASPHRGAEEGIQALWDLAITSASIWLKHLRNTVCWKAQMEMELIQSRISGEE